MDDLTLDDIANHVVDVTPVEFLGKRAYIRKLSFDGAVMLSEEFGGRDDDEASARDMRFMIALVLCDADGNLLFSDPSDGLDMLGRLSADDLTPLFEQINSENGLSVEAEEKNLKAVP